MKEKRPVAETSTLRCVISGTWTLLSLPFWLAAAGLFAVSTMPTSRLFAVALICLLPLPLNLLHWRRTSRKIAALLLLVVGGSALFLCGQKTENSPGKTDDPARLVCHDESPSHLLPWGFVAEVDQFSLRFYFMAATDSDLSWSRAAELREIMKDLYSDLSQDPQLSSLPSLLGTTYRDMLGIETAAGPVFTYIPEISGSNGSGKRAALVILHGSLGNLQGSWFLWKQLADSTGVAVVAPTFGSGEWSRTGGRAAIAQAREFCITHPDIDEGRLILAGIGRGGTGALQEAAALPQEWERLLLLAPVTEELKIGSKSLSDAWRGRKAMIISEHGETSFPGQSIHNALTGMEALGIRLTTHYLSTGDRFLFLPDWSLIRQQIESWLKENP